MNRTRLSLFYLAGDALPSGRVHRPVDQAPIGVVAFGFVFTLSSWFADRRAGPTKAAA